MITRALMPDDMSHVRRLHDKYFGNDFANPDFMEKFLNAFAITDDDGKIIIAGGVKPLAETIIVTDKESHSMTTIGRALVEAQRISMFTCREYGIDWLHAFVKDEAYMKHLIQHGFRKRCQALSIKVPNGR